MSRDERVDETVVANEGDGERVKVTEEPEVVGGVAEGEVCRKLDIRGGGLERGWEGEGEGEEASLAGGGGKGKMLLVRASWSASSIGEGEQEEEEDGEEEDDWERECAWEGRRE